MSEQTQSSATPESDQRPRCPWCSAILSSADDARCPSCSAALRDAADKELPGVTAIDHEAILRSRKPPAKPGGLIGWLSGSYQEAPEASPAPETFSPPDPAVKREMLRMELAAIEARVEAQRAEIEAELVAARVRLPSNAGESADEAGASPHVEESTEAAEAASDGERPYGEAPDQRAVTSNPPDRQPA
ncbi:MAG: hypothetical protein HYX54_09360 [Chloroflexi bacterium]|nr:hypothetical protein [Chloroflexota bacterium]